MISFTKTVMVLVVAGMMASCGNDSRIIENTVPGTTKSTISPAAPDSIPASSSSKTVGATKSELWDLVPETIETQGGTVVVPAVYLSQIKTVLSNGTFTSGQLGFVVDRITDTTDDSEYSLLYPIRSSNATSWRDFTANYQDNMNVFKANLVSLGYSCGCSVAINGASIQVSQNGKVISTSSSGSSSTGSGSAGWWGDSGGGEAVIDGTWFQPLN
jgi:hypothetical protein